MEEEGACGCLGEGLARPREQQAVGPGCGEGPWFVPQIPIQAVWPLYIHMCRFVHSNAGPAETTGG